jgi:predicted dehydrogenase
MDQNENMPKAGAETRRSFLRKTATATAAAAAANLFVTPIYGQTTAPSTGRVIGANDRIHVGLVGVGMQGSYHLTLIKTYAQQNNVDIVAVCDLWDKRREKAKADVGGSVVAYEDYRKLLDNKDVDAVLCATPHQWHAQISIDALHAGKHLYCEKPMTRYLDEAFRVYKAAKASGKVYQMGVQACSDEMWLKTGALLKGGDLGKPVLGQVSYMRNTPKGEWNYPIDPDFKASGIDWNTWLGPNIHARPPFSPEVYFRWRKYYPFNNGVIGDMLPHKVTPLMMAAKPQFPLRVCAIGTTPVLPTDPPGTPKRDCPENLTVIADFPDAFSMMACASTVNETGLPFVIRTNMADLNLGGNSVRVMPEAPYSDDIDPNSYMNLRPGEAVNVHENNWFDCIRSGKPTHTNEDLALRSQTVLCLAEMSNRLGMNCHFDPKNETLHDRTGKEIAPITYGTLPRS